ncbi:MAG: hypothetical protein ACLQUY_20590 [Ktedonobacterales bacterium]
MSASLLSGEVLQILLVLKEIKQGQQWQLTRSHYSDRFGGRSAHTLCPPLDAQQALAHHRDVGELHKQAKQDRRREPAVVQAHPRDQAGLVVILGVQTLVPGRVTFLIPPEQISVGVKILDIHALFSIWTERYRVSHGHVLPLWEDALGTGLT